MHLHGSLFPDDYPATKPVEVAFHLLDGKAMLSINSVVTVHLGPIAGLEATHASLLAAADSLRLAINGLTLTEEELETLAATGESR